MPQQPNMNQMLKQVQKMQADMKAAQEKLKDEEVQGTAGGGAVKVTMSGDLEVKQVYIDPKAIDPDDPELLSDLITAAVNEAIREVTGQRVTVTFELRDDVVPEDRTMSAEELVERFKDEFDAEEIFEEEEV